jgi:peptidoglycan/LPS O-acetylase OafA/YrhL
MFFPYSAQKAKKMSNDQLIGKMITCFYLQIFLVALLLLPMLLILPYDIVFAVTTMNPWTRYPIFQMGIYAAELCLRHEDKPIIWPSSVLFFFPLYSCCGAYDRPAAVDLKSEAPYWSRVADVNSLFILCFTLSITVIETCVHYTVSATIFGSLWLQTFNPFLHLTILVALTRDGALSRASMFLRNKYLQFFGLISMCIYLVHFPIIDYICWAVNKGKIIHWPEVMNCESHYSNHQSDEYLACVDEVNAFNNVCLAGVSLWWLFLRRFFL